VLAGQDAANFKVHVSWQFPLIDEIITDPLPSILIPKETSTSAPDPAVAAPI
jgi:hypothetical protein